MILTAGALQTKKGSRQNVRFNVGTYGLIRGALQADEGGTQNFRLSIRINVQGDARKAHL
jgi:hypothetical protein